MTDPTLSSLSSPACSLHRASASIPHKAVLVSLLSSTYACSNSNNYNLGGAPRTPAALRARTSDMAWFYERYLRLADLQLPTMLWLAPAEDRDSGAEVLAMVVLREFDRDGRLAGAGRKAGLFGLLRSGLLLGVPWRFGFEALLRIRDHGAAGTLLHRAVARANGRAHRRLDFVCTRLDMQGKGMCTRLIRQVCADADADGVLLYLSSSDDANQRFYERFGFVQLGSASCDPAQITTVAMARNPVCGGGGGGDVESGGGGGGDGDNDDSSGGSSSSFSSNAPPALVAVGVINAPHHISNMNIAEGNGRSAAGWASSRTATIVTVALVVTVGVAGVFVRTRKGRS